MKKLLLAILLLMPVLCMAGGWRLSNGGPGGTLVYINGQGATVYPMVGVDGKGNTVGAFALSGVPSSVTQASYTVLSSSATIINLKTLAPAAAGQINLLLQSPENFSFDYWPQTYTAGTVGQAWSNPGISMEDTASNALVLVLQGISGTAQINGTFK
jgi:hypothetical protein